MHGRTGRRQFTMENQLPVLGDRYRSPTEVRLTTGRNTRNSDATVSTDTRDRRSQEDVRTSIRNRRSLDAHGCWRSI